MKRFRRKKGSSLILVVFITAVVFTVATTMVAVVTNDYKTRVNESKKLQNLYQSDAQLDVVYNVIAKNADVAAKYAYNRAKYEYNNNNVKSSSILEDTFKQAFVNFLMKDYNGDPILKQAINKRRLIKFNSTNVTCEGYQDKDNYTISETDNSTDLDVNTGDDKNLQKNQLDIKLTNNGDNIVAEVTSTFTSNNEVQGQPTETINGKLKNTKKITTKYTIEAPKYSNDVISTSVSNKETNQYAVEKAITADGNLNVQDGASLNVLGNYYDKDSNFVDTGDADIWIKGNDKSIRDKYNVENDKYAYGVVLGNSKLNVTGNVYTNGSLTLSNSSDADISADLYAYNAYLGPIKYDQSTNEAGENNLKANNIYTNNDLVMNSYKSSISADNYVGMGDYKETNDKIGAAKNSSSIIVNSNINADGSNTAYGSKIELNSATVAGLAYMNTNGDSYFTTGESVAVKGNYVAYSDSLSSSDKHKEYNFEQYDAWDLLEGTTEQKATHFEQYFKTGSNDIKDGGIKIGKLSSTGAGVNNGKLSSHASASEQAAIMQTQSESKNNYGKNVYAMGNDSYLKDNVNEDLSQAGLDCYNDISKMATVGVTNQNPMVNFNKLNDTLGSDGMDQLYSNIKLGTVYNNYNGYALLNANNDDMTIERTNSGVIITLGSRELIINENDMPTDPKTGDRTLNAVIITKGNVTLKGNLNINGTVISAGDVNVEAGSKVTVKHDPVVISKTVAQNSQFFEDLLNGKPIDATTKIEPVQVGVHYNDSNNSAAAAGWYDATKYLKKGLWKLEGEKGGVLGK